MRRGCNKSTHVTGWRDPTYRVAAAIKGSSHRVDQHGTCHVQVHDATRATTAGPSECSRRTCEPGGAHAFAGGCVTLAWHKARACKVCAPSSIALASIALALARACAAEQCSRQEARGAHPRTPAGSGEQRTWGARGAHPRTPAGRRLACEQGARDAETHGRAVLSRVGVMACEYSFIVLGLTSQRSSSEFRRIRVEILGLTYLGYQVFGC